MTTVLLVLLLAGLPLLLSGLLVQPVHAQTSIYVGTNPTGIAVNPNTNDVYVTNSGDGTVSVIDGDSSSPTFNTVIGAPITVGSGAGSDPIGVAVNPNTNNVYVTNFNDGTVTVIDGDPTSPTFNTVIGAPITVGDNPTGVAVDPNTNDVYVANNGGGTVSVIDGLTNTVDPVSPITVGSFPLGVTVNPNTDNVYVANNGGDTVTVIDGLTNTVDLASPITVGSGPIAVAVNPNTNMVYVANAGDGTVTVIDGLTNTVDPVSPITVGSSPYGVAVDPTTNNVYVANNDGTVSVIYGSTNTVDPTLLYISNGGIDSLDAVNPSTGTLYVGYYDGGLITAEPLGLVTVSLSCGDTIIGDVTLGADIGPCSGSGLVIGASGITLDCAGSTITGTYTNTGYGIDLEGYTGVTVENCNVRGFEFGFLLGGSSSNTLTGNTANNNFDGFRLYLSDSNILRGNTANNNNFDGFNVVDSSSNTLTGNTANYNSEDGFTIFDSPSNTLNGNVANSNYLAGFYLEDYYSPNTLGGNTLGETNIADSNTNYGYLDNSVGSGTSGTANTYVSDECNGNGSGSSPDGLCMNSPLSAGDITPSSPTINQGDSVTLTANPSDGVPPYTTYQWYTSLGCTDPIPYATSSTYDASPPVTTTYYYEVYDSAASAACSAGDTVTVVSSPPIPAFPFPFAIPVVLAATAAIYLAMRKSVLGGRAVPAKQWT